MVTTLATSADASTWLSDARHVGVSHVQVVLRTWRTAQRPVMGEVRISAFSAATVRLLPPGAAAAGEPPAADMFLDLDAANSCEDAPRQAAAARSAGRSVAL